MSRKKKIDLTKSSGAIISKCEKYRYVLWRTWGDDEKYVSFICLNPSSADATEDDPTLTRCINYAKSWGYSGIVLGNLFAFRATKIPDMLKQSEPIGKDNDYYLELISNITEKTVAAWGNNGSFLNRSEQVKEIFPNLYALEISKQNQPKHPLYLLGSLTPKKIKK